MNRQLVFFFFLALLVVVNLFVLDYFLIFKKESPPLPIPSPAPTIAIIPSPTAIPSSAPKTTTIPSSPRSKTKAVSYVPVPGSGSLLSSQWADISGTEFYFNPDDYPGLKDAYFEANIRLFNGNGTAFVRLFDTTVGIEVWGSELQSKGQSFSVVTSGKLTLRSGNHLYRVQVKSSTADSTVFGSGRLKIISQN